MFSVIDFFRDYIHCYSTGMINATKVYYLDSLSESLMGFGYYY
jgi:hypothetical protein